MKRRLFIRTAFVAAVCAGCLGILFYSAERMLQRRTGQSWLINGWSGLGPTIHDPLLGWTSPPSTHWPDLYGPGEHCTYNARGFRALEEYGDVTPAGRTRILCLGDSFVDGLGVDDRATFPAQLEEIRPAVQAVNMAKISYGIDQAVLRYERDAQGMDADFVLLAVIDDDLNRSRWDHFNGYWPKPRFLLSNDGGLELTGAPVPDFSEPIHGPRQLVRRSALFLLTRQYFQESRYRRDDTELAGRILDRLCKLANARGHRVALGYLPTLAEVETGKLLPLAAILELYAADHSLPYIQTADRFAQLSRVDLDDSFLAVNGHYSRMGNRLVAESVAAGLGL